MYTRSEACCRNTSFIAIKMTKSQLFQKHSYYNYMYNNRLIVKVILASLSELYCIPMLQILLCVTHLVRAHSYVLVQC